MFDPETHPSVPTLRTTKAARRRSGQKRGQARGTGRFFALSLGKKYRTRLLIRDGARGRTLSRKVGPETEGDPPAAPSSSFKIKNYKSFLVVVVAGGYVGEGEHFPVFAQQNGGSAAVRLKADRPHIHGQFRRNRGRGVQL